MTMPWDEEKSKNVVGKNFGIKIGGEFIVLDIRKIVFLKIFKRIKNRNLFELENGNFV